MVDLKDLNKLLKDFPEVDKDCRKDFSVVYYDSITNNKQTESLSTLEDTVDELKRRKRALELSIGSLKNLKVGATTEKLSLS